MPAFSSAIDKIYRPKLPMVEADGDELLGGNDIGGIQPPPAPLQG